MKPRILHIGGSFVIVLVTYWTYALMAVPLIDPPAPPPMQSPSFSGPPTFPDILHPPADPKPSDRDEMRPIFQPGDWELGEAKLLKGEQFRLLVKEYKNLDGGWIELSPMTIIFVSDDPALTPLDRILRSVVLQVPEGARIRFDPPMDMTRLKMGRMVEGILRGPITIRSHGKLRGGKDELCVTTHDVNLSEQRIWTPNPVDFRYGPHSGRGRDMEIRLAPREGPSGSRIGPNIGGIEQFTMNVVERLHLDMGPMPGAGHGGQTAGTPTMAASGAGYGTPAPILLDSQDRGPVEVTCAGPFCFNVVQQVATFRDRVDVTRLHATGPSDHLTCELLSIYFAKAAAQAEGEKKARAPGFDLVAQRIEAEGKPVNISAPANNTQGRGERLQYDIPTQRISLDGGREVYLIQNGNEIHAPSLSYTPPPPGRLLGQLLAKGPGWLRGASATQANQSLEAAWKGELRIEPDNQAHRISLTGGTRLQSPAFGWLDAQTVKFWLVETADRGPKNPPRLQPDRMLAEGDVRGDGGRQGDTTQLSMAVDFLEVRFMPAAPSLIPGPQPGMNLQPGVVQNGMPQPALPGYALPGANPIPGAGPSALPNAAAPPERPRHMELTAHALKAVVLLRESPPGAANNEPKGELTELTVLDNIRLIETPTGQPGEKPLLLTGRWLKVTDANLPQSKITIVGELAHFEGRGQSLEGPQIVVDRGANVLAVAGPGVMKSPIDKDFDGQPLKQPGVLRIQWQGGMRFEGTAAWAHFEDHVIAQGPTQQLKTPKLDAWFMQPISFSDSKAQPPSKPKALKCSNGVLLENRSSADGQQTSQDWMTLADLSVDAVTGDMYGTGPGTAVSVTRGGLDMSLDPGSGPGQRARAPSAPPHGDPSALKCVHLRFLGSMDGNFRRKEVNFHDRVRVAMAEVHSWAATLESDDPKELADKAMVLKSDNMQVIDMSPTGAHRNVELQATGNVKAEGTQSGKLFMGNAARMSYSELKGLLILEGDARNLAQISQQDSPGSAVQKTMLQKIMYWPQTHMVKGSGNQLGDSQQFPDALRRGNSVPSFPGLR